MEYKFEYNVVDDLHKAKALHTAIPQYVETMTQYLENRSVDRYDLRDQFSYVLKKFHKKEYLIAAIDLFNSTIMDKQDKTGETWLIHCPFDPENKNTKTADRFHIFGAILFSFPDQYNGCFPDMADVVVGLVDEIKKQYKIK